MKIFIITGIYTKEVQREKMIIMQKSRSKRDGNIMWYILIITSSLDHVIKGKKVYLPGFITIHSFIYIRLLGTPNVNYNYIHCTHSYKYSKSITLVFQEIL